MQLLIILIILTQPALYHPREYYPLETMCCPLVARRSTLQQQGCGRYLGAGSRPGDWRGPPPLTPGGRSSPRSAETPTSLTCGGAAEPELEPGLSPRPGALASSSAGPPWILAGRRQRGGEAGWSPLNRNQISSQTRSTWRNCQIRPIDLPPPGGASGNGGGQSPATTV